MDTQQKGAPRSGEPEASRKAAVCTAGTARPFPRGKRPPAGSAPELPPGGPDSCKNAPEKAR